MRRTSIASTLLGSARRTAFTLVEVLVVIAIIGLLTALLLPAVSAVMESARRLQCQNNFRQLSTAMQSFVATEGVFPAGAVSKQYAPTPGHPHQFYRWSALARLTPYLQRSDVFFDLNFEVPLYMPNLLVSPHNTTAVRQMVASFLCPSDRQSAVENDFGSTNYVTCTGSGINGGTPFDTDGMFFANSSLRTRDILDGTTNTILMSESLLGDGPKNLFNPETTDPRTIYRFANSAPLNERSCQSSTTYNFRDRRGFSWANGEYRCTLYNHYLGPNSPQFDCISARLVGDVTVRFSAFGWRAARSNHRGGVNVMMADGSSHFVDDNIDLGIWRALSTREGRETSRLP